MENLFLKLETFSCTIVTDMDTTLVIFLESDEYLYMIEHIMND